MIGYIGWGSVVCPKADLFWTERGFLSYSSKVRDLGKWNQSLSLTEPVFSYSNLAQQDVLCG